MQWNLWISNKMMHTVPFKDRFNLLTPLQEVLVIKLLNDLIEKLLGTCTGVEGLESVRGGVGGGT